MASLELASFDVIVVPFPFTDRQATRRRPALVLSTASFNHATRHSVLAMITSAEQSNWPGDVHITDLDAAGLPSECLVRLKLFTLDHRLIVKRVGKLATKDREILAERWKPLVFQ
jgi:mRNA interferase MazF